MLDLLVIGAGLSGLQAAYSARDAGLNVKVIEARDRVGGKTWTYPVASAGASADLGAAWINDQLQPRITAWVRRFGIKTVAQRLGGTAIMQLSPSERSEFPFGIMPDFAPHEKKNLEMIRDHIQAESQKKVAPLAEDDSKTLDEYVRSLGGLPKTRQMVNLWSRVMHGVESTEQSAAWFIDYCRRNHGLLAIRADDASGGNYQRTHEGTQVISLKIAELLGRERITLSSPVASIEDQSGKVTVRSTNGESWSARKCIISIPSTMFKTLRISPPLPPRLEEVTSSTILGDYNKAIIIYSKPWWRESGYNGFFMSFSSPVCLARDTSVDELGFYSLTCFVNGENGRQWGKLYPDQRKKAVLDQLAHVYNQGPESPVHKPVDFVSQIWKHEEYSQGALAPITAIGHYTRFADVYGKPAGNLHFVGTEYSPGWKGYMEGALCSGEIGAAEVVEALRATDARAKL